MRWLFLLLLSCFPSDRRLADIGTQEEVKREITTSESVNAYLIFAIGQPERIAKWHIVPAVRVCAATEITKDQANTALRFWKALGYKFGNVYLDYNLSCSAPLYGEIIFTLPEGDIGNTNLAATRIFTSKTTGEIVKAKIFIYPSSAKKPRVMEHELGHALGWKHYKQKFHMMNPTWYMGGTDHSGLRN